jgi:CheY-like chemotaxis protein
VSNAIKFTDIGEVKVFSSAEKATDENFKIQFSVKDTGIGIPKNAEHKLFNSFSQADVSTTRKYGGSGLGLAICKGLCEKMGGNIWFESEPGKGSQFFFNIILPATRARESTDAPTLLIQENTTIGKNYPLNILIAEDNRVNQLVAVGLLEKLSYHPDIAANGLEVLSCLENKSYDIVFMDLHMPEMDGFETSQKIIEKFSPNQRPCIIALTASAMKEDIDRCLDAGMDDFISKPIQLKEIIRALKTVIIEKRKITANNPPPERTLPMSDAAPLNQEEIFSNFSGIEDVLIKSIESFIELKPSLLNNIHQAITSKDSTSLEISAHTLTGAASNFFAEPVKMLAWKLEQCGASGDLSRAEDDFKKLSTEIEKLCSALNELKKR